MGAIGLNFCMFTRCAFVHVLFTCCLCHCPAQSRAVRSNDGEICELACSTLFLILRNGVRKRMIPHTEFFKGVSGT